MSAAKELHFAPDLPAGEAWAAIFAGLLVDLRDNLDGTREQRDPEDLHDFRVAVRRARAAVKFGYKVIERPVAESYAVELKWLGDQTSPSRDLDVYLLQYDDLAARVAEPETLDPFRERLVRQAADAHGALEQALASLRFADLVAGWEHDLATTHTGRRAERPIGTVAARRLRKAWRRAHKRGRAIDDDSPSAAFHDLRKRGKELRYLLEFFASLHQSGPHEQLIKQLKRLQDNLGAHQDLQAQRSLIRSHAAALAREEVAAATLAGMRQLEEELASEQQRVRAEFAERWREFDSSGNQRRYEELV